MSFVYFSFIMSLFTNEFYIFYMTNNNGFFTFCEFHVNLYYHCFILHLWAFTCTYIFLGTIYIVGIIALWDMIRKRFPRFFLLCLFIFCYKDYYKSVLIKFIITCMATGVWVLKVFPRFNTRVQPWTSRFNNYLYKANTHTLFIKPLHYDRWVAYNMQYCILCI